MICPFKLSRCSNDLTEDKGTGTYHINGTSLSFKIHQTAREVDKRIPRSQGLFDGLEYQNLMDEFTPEKIQAAYIAVYENGSPLGLIVGQIARMKGNESFKLDEGEHGLTASAKRKVLNSMDFRAFLVGNILLTGHHGFRFEGKALRESFVIVEVVTHYALPVIEKQYDCHLSMIFYKDFTDTQSDQSESLGQAGFHRFSTEACMVMDIPSEWESFEDYLAAMSSKYRVRAKRAFKKGKGIERRELDHADILHHNDRIYELYEMVTESVDFNSTKLHPMYFAELKRRFAGEFHLTGYFLEGELIAYYTTLHKGGETHAHFLGMDSSYNRSHQVYLNILYDIVRDAIAAGSRHIDFARTAPEIKSSVGAVPVELYFFVKHRRGVLNKMMPPLFKMLEQKKDIVYRSPFKDSQKTAEKAAAPKDSSAPSSVTR